MAKDFIQDIVPPSNGGGKNERKIPVRQPQQPIPNNDLTAHADEPHFDESDEDTLPAVDVVPERSIRNIAPPRPRARTGDSDIRDVPPPVANAQSSTAYTSAPRRSRPKWILWVIALICLVILAILGLFVLRSTTVSITPRSHTIVFDQTAQFTAYPVSDAATGTLTYTAQNSDIEDSEVVPSKGTQHVESKASGSLTVFNDVSPNPVRLIKNTRFSTPDGLIFRVPADVLVPAMKGATPGSVSVTVVSDQVGTQYNVAASTKFTLPGLKTNADMYAHVYAQNSEAFVGGFSGDQPGVDQTALDSAKAIVRARLEQKAHDSLASLSTDSSTVFADLMQITYTDLPNTTEAGNSVRIHEKAHIVVPVFPAGAFAQNVAQSVAADADSSAIKLIGGKGYSAHFASATSTSIGSDPLVFGLSGTGQLVWQVDSDAISKALAGKDQTAFQNIVTGFAGVQEARARIEPFWKRSFPSNPSDIKVKILAPSEAKAS